MQLLRVQRDLEFASVIRYESILPNVHQLSAMRAIPGKLYSVSNEKSIAYLSNSIVQQISLVPFISDAVLINCLCVAPLLSN